ncbi:hypothetical protein ADT71_12330 [Novosphingobium sp. ST904]|nr:hypothetical protein ADT71_12330 [Novosphingobium sp. ST904]
MSAEETRLADISTDSIIVFGPTGQIHYWNPAAESLFGWPAIAVVGRSISDLSLAADEDPAWRQLLQEGSWQGTISAAIRAAKMSRRVCADLCGSKTTGPFGILQKWVADRSG